MNQIGLLQTIYNNEGDLLEKVRVHVESGADLNGVTEYCESALRVASNNGRFKVVKLLLDSGADKSQLGWTNSFYMVAYGTVDGLQNSIAEHDDLEERDCWKRTPLLLSIECNPSSAP